MAQQDDLNYLVVVAMIFVILGIIYLFNQKPLVVRDTVTRYVPVPGPHHRHHHRPHHMPRHRPHHRPHQRPPHRPHHKHHKHHIGKSPKAMPSGPKGKKGGAESFHLGASLEGVVNY